MTNKEKIRLVEEKLDRNTIRCKERNDSAGDKVEYNTDSCGNPSHRLFRDPSDGSLWMPCENHLYEYIEAVGWKVSRTWKEVT